MMTATCSCEDCVSLVRVGLWYGADDEQPTWLPVGPLLDRIAAAGGLAACGAGASDRRSVERARQRGVIRDRVADRLAIRLLGVHPWSVWGDGWWIDPEKRGGSVSLSCDSVQA